MYVMMGRNFNVFGNVIFLVYKTWLLAKEKQYPTGHPGTPRGVVYRKIYWFATTVYSTVWVSAENSNVPNLD